MAAHGVVTGDSFLSGHVREDGRYCALMNAAKPDLASKISEHVAFTLNRAVVESFGPGKEECVCMNRMKIVELIDISSSFLQSSINFLVDLACPTMPMQRDTSLQDFQHYTYFMPTIEGWSTEEETSLCMQPRSHCSESGASDILIRF